MNGQVHNVTAVL